MLNDARPPRPCRGVFCKMNKEAFNFNVKSNIFISAVGQEKVRMLKVACDDNDDDDDDDHKDDGDGNQYVKGGNK